MASRSIGKILRNLQFRPVKDMKFTFDPYKNNVRSIREVLFQLQSPKLISTNENVNMKLDVKSDRSDPRIDINFSDGQKLIFKTANLTTLEILDRLNQVCMDKDPKKNEVATLTTKTARKKR
ncbi:large ribosomal subunit protein mL53-like [Haliotis asinina]|uniref:large ribosomal subunit protein mL53-like n=1 Tax=Haliotis asinina TaxID=109174 RepID=UPI0035325373